MYLTRVLVANTHLGFGGNLPIFYRWGAKNGKRFHKILVSLPFHSGKEYWKMKRVSISQTVELLTGVDIVQQSD